MSWSQVVIKTAAGFEYLEVAVLISNKGGYVPAWRAAGMPAQAKVYEGRDADGNPVFYFNPAASTIAGELLSAFDAVACDQPDLTGFTPLVL